MVVEETNNAEEISSVLEKETASKVGYNSSDFNWFGNSTPDKARVECLMCNNIYGIKLLTLITNGTPEVCPHCKQKCLKIHDGERWQKYIQLKLWEFELFLDQYHESHTIYNNGSRHIFKLKGNDMERILAMRCKNPNQIKTATVYLDGLAAQSGQIRSLDNRIGKNEDGILIDAASEHGEAIKITTDGWQVVDEPPVMFRHFEHQLPFIAEIGYKRDFDDYVELMNLSSPEDKLLFSGYAATLFIPEIDHPILMPIGPQGSAKTTMSMMTKMLIDPSKTPLLTMPEKAEKLPLIFHFHYFPIFDNCNYFSQEVSDMFCRACTGGGISTRKLYTDMDEVTFSFHSPIILNGISAPSMSQDLMERSLIVSLDRILEQNRKEKSIIEAKRDALLPKVRGYLMGIVADAMGAEPYQTTMLPRLADFARRADACCVAMGYKQGEFMEAYLNLTREAAKEAVRSDPVADALLEYLEVNGSWDGSASELLKVLGEIAGQNTKSPHWPKDSTRLSDSLLGKLKTGLVGMGWSIKKMKSNGKRSLKIWKDEVVSGGVLSF
jgi:hypothetical protein